MPSVTVSSDDFSRAVSAARHVVAGRTTIPVFESVFLDAGNGVMRVCATSADHGVEMQIPCDGEGQWVINHAKLSAFTSAAPRGKPVTVSGDILASFRCGSVSARIASLPASEFPEFSSKPIFSEKPTWETASFPALLSRLAPICNDNPAAIFARAIHVSIDGTKGRAFAVNGFAMARQDFNTSFPADVSLAIDMTSAPVIASLFDRGEVWIAQEGRTLWLKSRTVTYHAKTVDCERHALGDLEYTDGPQATADADTLLRAVKAVQSMASGKDNKIAFHSDVTGSFVGGSGDAGSVLCVPFDCEAPCEMSEMVNGELLRDVTTASGSENIIYGLRTETSDGRALPRQTLFFGGNGFFGFLVPLVHNGAEIADAKASFNAGQQ